MKKRSFVLLEVLIAFSLIFICVIPLIQQPLRLFRTEWQRLEEMETERLAAWTFSEVKEKLLNGEFSWDQIPEKKKKSPSYTLADGWIEIPGAVPKKVIRKFYLTGKKEKTGLQNEVIRKIEISIVLNGKKYQYFVPVILK